MSETLVKGYYNSSQISSYTLKKVCRNVFTDYILTISEESFSIQIFNEPSVNFKQIGLFMEFLYNLGVDVHIQVEDKTCHKE